MAHFGKSGKIRVQPHILGEMRTYLKSHQVLRERVHFHIFAMKSENWFYFTSLQISFTEHRHLIILIINHHIFQKSTWGEARIVDRGPLALSLVVLEAKQLSLRNFELKLSNLNFSSSIFFGARQVWLRDFRLRLLIYGKRQYATWGGNMVTGINCQIS